MCDGCCLIHFVLYPKALSKMRYPWISSPMRHQTRSHKKKIQPTGTHQGDELFLFTAPLNKTFFFNQWQKHVPQVAVVLAETKGVKLHLSSCFEQKPSAARWLLGERLHSRGISHFFMENNRINYKWNGINRDGQYRKRYQEHFNNLQFFMQLKFPSQLPRWNHTLLWVESWVYACVVFLACPIHEETRLYLLRMEGEEIHCRLGIFDLRLGRDSGTWMSGDECQVTSDFNDLNYLDLVVLREPWNLLGHAFFRVC